MALQAGRRKVQGREDGAGDSENARSYPALVHFSRRVKASTGGRRIRLRLNPARFIQPCPLVHRKWVVVT